MRTIFLGTACPYVNAAPHIGHALEYVQADCYVRFQRLVGNDIFFCAGSDENSLKNVLIAEKLKINEKAKEEIKKRKKESERRGKV